MSRSEDAHEAYDLAQRTGVSFEAAMKLMSARTPQDRRAAEKQIEMETPVPGDEIGADWLHDWNERYNELLGQNGS